MTEHPGCYGLPSAISESSPSCRVCPSNGSCGIEAQALLGGLPESPLIKRERQSLATTCRVLASVRSGGEGVGSSEVVRTSCRGVKRIALSPKQEEQIALLPVQVRTAFRRLMELNWFEFAKAEMLAGRTSGSGWQKVFCSMLVANNCTRGALTLAFQTELGMTASSAKVKASLAIKIFSLGRLATEQFGQIVLSRN